MRITSGSARWRLARLVLAAGALACGLAACVEPLGQCGPGRGCPTGQLCHATHQFCYVPDGPAVSWASPQVGQALRGTGATVTGIISLAGEYTAEISVGRPDLWQPLSVSAAGQFSATLALPRSDGQPQPLRIRVAQPASAGGRVSVSSIYRPVDNVAPTFHFSESVPRPTPTTVRVVASEPLAARSLIPTAILEDGGGAWPGRWNADRTELRFEGLRHDATYTVTLPQGALEDLSGNPTESTFSVTFTTGPAAPPPDALISIGSLDLTDLEAFSDAEGAVSVVLASAQGIVVWGELDPRTGRFRMISQAAGSGLQGFQAISAPMPGRRWADGSSQRALGMMMTRAAAGPAVQSVIYADVYSSPASGLGAGRGALVSINPGGLSYVPGPASCAEAAGASTVEMSPATGQLAFRRGATGPAALSLPAPPSWSLFHDAQSLEWVTVSGGTLSRTPRTCSCAGGTPACAVGPTQPVGSSVLPNPRLSVADTRDDDRAYAYDTSSGRTLTCLRDCRSGTCSVVGSETGGATSELSVASANEASLILQAERSGGAVVLSQRDLQDGCGNGAPPEELGRLTTGSSIRRFRPVMFGRKPGLLYLSTAGGPGVLRTFIP